VEPAPLSIESVLDLAGEAIVTVDERETVRSWNRAAEALLGYPRTEIVGRPYAVIVPPDRLAAGEPDFLRRQVAAHGVVRGFLTERLAKDGRRVRVSLTYSRVASDEGQGHDVCQVMLDLGAHRAVIHQLYESERLAALRAMAVGLAHEIGNPLAGVLALLQLAERRTAEPDTRAGLAEARRELTRLGRIIRELTDFTRADDARGTIDVNKVLREVLVFARYAHEATPVTVTLDEDPTIGLLVGRPHHLLQACLYLVMNAYEAMRESGGSLTVRSRRGDGEVVVRVEDTGPGIEPEIVPRIFDPFFTTKPEGFGTGLGLFVCQRIVCQEFGGRVDVETAPGAGACFTVRLPVRA
jgi:two-component system NtrC family sensor kinase